MLSSAVTIAAKLKNSSSDHEGLINYSKKFNESYSKIQTELDAHLETLLIENMPNKKSLTFVTNYLYKFSTIVHILDKNAANFKTNLLKLERANKDIDFKECRGFVNFAKQIKKSLIEDYAKCLSKIRSIETELQNQSVSNDKPDEMLEFLSST